MIEIDKKRLCVVGDIHGELSTLVYNISERFDFKDTAFIIAGDIGLGFEKREHYEILYNQNKERLEKRGNIIYGIRGNHDDNCGYFKAETKIDFPRFKTIPDYEPLCWENKIILPIGGANSIDKKIRLEENKKWEEKGSTKRCWWPDERPEHLETFDSLPRHVDIVISHEAPMSCGPVLVRESWMDFEMYENIKEDRTYLYNILKEMTPERWYFGHHHNSYSGTCGGTLYKGLDIHEIIEVIYYD